jgi:outer membrane protein TolC
LVLVILILCALSGCKAPATYRLAADKTATAIIQEKQTQALGRTEPQEVLRPSEILRRRILEQQGLPYSSQASLGTDALVPVPHWPDPGYPPAASSIDANIPVEPNGPVRISLIEALRVAAANSPEYQTRKERVFQAALDLDLTRNEFRTILTASGSTNLTADDTGEPTRTQVSSQASGGLSRQLKSGAELTAALALDLTSLLAGGVGSTLGLRGDTSISIPLLRGAGRHIITEPLTQAERQVIYELWNFERYKKTFAVSVAREYFNVLQQMDRVKNAEDNYRSAIASARWSRRRADAGRIAEIEVDQAVQRELSARTQWISAQEQYKRALDNFKNTLGLPTDAQIELDRSDLERLQATGRQYIEQLRGSAQREVSRTSPAADAPVELVPPSKEGAGPLEMDESVAIKTALDNRLDLRVAIGQVYDAQRKVVVAADNLRTGLNLKGSASWTDNDDDGGLGFNGGRYSALLSLDLPLERTRERNAYRNSLISLEQAVRQVQTLEDQIKLAIRNDLRNLLESRENLKIQAQAVVVAEKRVKSTTLFLEAGRAAIRDLLEAQDALLAAQNALTAAVVSYRIAELELQRDLDLLHVDTTGLWKEYRPGEQSDEGIQ